MENLHSPIPQPTTEIAAVDLGSNSFHLVIARVHDGQLRIIDRLREPVRLAAGLDAANNLSETSRQAAMQCLARFGQRLANLPSECVRAVGTNTLRSANNSPDFIDEAERALGHAIEIVAGIEEARLIYQGVSHSLAADNKRRLVIDIGGGSTELIIGDGYDPLLMESLYMGCVSTSRQHLANGVLTREALDKALLAAHLELEPKVSAYRHQGWDDVVGASGTIRAVGKVIKANHWGQDGITLAALHRIRDEIVAAGQLNKLLIPGLSVDRAPVFSGGLMILLACFEALGIEHMQVTDGALREGLLYDLLGRIRHEDVRAQSVAALANRYHVDGMQARRVSQTAEQCLHQVSRAWKLDDEAYRRRLAWAASLHEIGLDIAHNQYNKHGAYIIEHTDMAGFSLLEQKLIALLVLGHRRKFPLKALRALEPGLAKVMQRLIILLRLAALLHRSRSEQALPFFRLDVDKKVLALGFPAGWLDAHPLTRGDLEQEASFLAEIELTLVFR